MTLQDRLRDYINDIDDCRLRLEAADRIDELEAMESVSIVFKQMKHIASLQHQIDAGQDQTRRLGEVIEWHQKDALELQVERDASASTVQKLLDGIRFCIGYKAYPSSELLRIGYESEEILRKRDAKIREDMLDRFRCKQMDYANEIEREMADELEQGK